MTVVLKTRGLTKKYGSFAALDNVSLNLRQGDIYGLVGRNGAGKTTLFKCLMGLAKPTEGQIDIGDSQEGTTLQRRQIGFMIAPAFFGYLGPKQNLDYLCQVKGIRTKGESARVLEIVGLTGVKQSFRAFSLGMKQRLGIAGALLGSPPVVVLDEPINGLDPQGIADMRAVIQNANQELGTTFIVSSHILSELDLVATCFGFIEQGHLLQEISSADLHERTKKTLLIEVDDAARAAEALRQTLGLDARPEGPNRLLLGSGADSGLVNRTLVMAGLAVSRLAPQETTLEEYFMHLIGANNA